MQVIAEAMVLMERNEDRMWEAELTRIKGELLLAQRTPSTDVEASFQHALTVACHQNARSFELRAATSLARLWLDNGKHRQAYDLRFPIDNWLTEGLDTPDLKDAKALLDELP